MRPRTLTVPKAMLEVAGRPFVDWQLERLAACGIRDVVFCVAYLAEQIRIFAERENQPCRAPERAAELFLLVLAGKSSMAALGARFASAPERKAWLDVVLHRFLGGRSSW